MNWIIVLVMLLFPQFQLGPNQVDDFLKSLQDDFGVHVVSDNVQEAKSRACQLDATIEGC